MEHSFFVLCLLSFRLLFVVRFRSTLLIPNHTVCSFMVVHFDFDFLVLPSLLIFAHFLVHFTFAFAVLFTHTCVCYSLFAIFTFVVVYLRLR